MLDLTNYKERLSESAHKLLTSALEESQRRQHYYLGVEHLFWALTEVEKSILDEIFREFNINIERVRDALSEYLNSPRQYLGVSMKIPPATKMVFKNAWDIAQRTGRDVIEATDIAIAILREYQSPPVRILRELGISPEVVAERIMQEMRNRLERAEEFKRKYELPPTLKNFGVNLNKLARLGKLTPIIGRDKEIDQIIEILCHRERANSVMLIGEAGVGKTAIVEGLAQRIELEPHRVPKRLRSYQIVNLQMNTVVAGTVFRGMFEDRIEKIINEVKERKNIILFIDEAHSLIGAGSALGVPSDAANIFKSALARGEVQIIGATTTAEYKEYIAEDEALARRFRVVYVKEPTIEETRSIIYGLKSRFEGIYNVKIEDSSLETALEMSKRYMRGLRLPDKVISWLDTSCVKAELYKEDHIVTPGEIIDVISESSGVPREMVVRDVSDKFKDLEASLARRVVGQREAIEALARCLRVNKGPLKERFSKPDGVLLFLGPTGVGKTEMAKALAEFLFGDEDRMVRLDMSEYKDSISVDKLIGMPRGIVGSERGGILTEAMRNNPYTVVLLDEIEKAHPFVHTLFLQVFDEGFLTDGRGKRVYFSDAIIIMTSNLGSDEFKKYTKPLGFMAEEADFKVLKQAVMREVEANFSPEFINRIDEIVVFSPLKKEEVKEIARMYLEKINSSMHSYGKEMKWTEQALEVLVSRGYSMKYGARFLKRTIDELVKVPITLHWKDGNSFLIDGRDSDIVVTWN